MFFMAGQTTGPIAIKFSELEHKSQDLVLSWKILLNLINTLITLVNCYCHDIVIINWPKRPIEGSACHEKPATRVLIY